MASINTRLNEINDKLDALMLEKNIPKPEPKVDPKVKAKDEKPKVKAKAKAKADDGDEKPKKKRTSGYIIYSNANRAEVKERLTEEAGDEKPKNTDVMKELARMWKELDDDEKEIWNTKAKEQRESSEEDDDDIAE